MLTMRFNCLPQLALAMLSSVMSLPAILHQEMSDEHGATIFNICYAGSWPWLGPISSYTPIPPF